MQPRPYSIWSKCMKIFRPVQKKYPFQPNKVENSQTPQFQAPLRLPWPRSPNSAAVVRQRPATSGATIRCMANSRRVKMVSKQIQRELSDMLLTDKVLQFAILPEASLGADKYLSSLTTITDVEVSADLQVVKVYVSVFGDERGKDVAMAGLKSKAKYVRSVLGKRMKLRLTPESKKSKLRCNNTKLCLSTQNVKGHGFMLSNDPKYIITKENA